jgi:hypothetical protein
MVPAELDEEAKFEFNFDEDSKKELIEKIHRKVWT